MSDWRIRHEEAEAASPNRPMLGSAGDAAGPRKYLVRKR
jgi:hypothetical protein